MNEPSVGFHWQQVFFFFQKKTFYSIPSLVILFEPQSRLLRILYDISLGKSMTSIWQMRFFIRRQCGKNLFFWKIVRYQAW